MDITIKIENNIPIAVVQSAEILIHDIPSALDFMATIRYETKCDHVILNKEAVAQSFFDLKTRLAGEILQKYVNYQFKIAIVGDYTEYKSDSLRDFIYESNKGNNAFFLSDQDQALAKLSH